MVDLPSVPAARVSIILPHDSPTPGINAQNGRCSHCPRFLPHRFNDLFAKSLAVDVCIGTTMHAQTFSLVPKMFLDRAFSAMARTAASQLVFARQPEGMPGGRPSFDDRPASRYSARLCGNGRSYS